MVSVQLVVALPSPVDGAAWRDAHVLLLESWMAIHELPIGSLSNEIWLLGKLAVVL